MQFEVKFQSFGKFPNVDYKPSTDPSSAILQIGGRSYKFERELYTSNSSSFAKVYIFYRPADDDEIERVVLKITPLLPSSELYGGPLSLSQTFYSASVFAKIYPNLGAACGRVVSKGGISLDEISVLKYLGPSFDEIFAIIRETVRDEYEQKIKIKSWMEKAIQAFIDLLKEQGEAYPGFGDIHTGNIVGGEDKSKGNDEIYFIDPLNEAKKANAKMDFQQLLSICKKEGVEISQVLLKEAEELSQHPRFQTQKEFETKKIDFNLKAPFPVLYRRVAAQLISNPGKEVVEEQFLRTLNNVVLDLDRGQAIDTLKLPILPQKSRLCVQFYIRFHLTLLKVAMTRVMGNLVDKEEKFLLSASPEGLAGQSLRDQKAGLTPVLKLIEQGLIEDRLQFCPPVPETLFPANRKFYLHYQMLSFVPTIFAAIEELEIKNEMPNRIDFLYELVNIIMEHISDNKPYPKIELPKYSPQITKTLLEQYMTILTIQTDAELPIPSSGFTKS